MSDPQATAPASETPEDVAPQTSKLAPPFERVLGCFVEFFPMILLVFIPVLGGLLATAYVLLRDGVFPGQSIGKRIMKIQVVDENTGKPATYRESVIRNAPLAINFFLPIVPFVGHILGAITGTIVFLVEVILIFTDEKHRRLGDKLAGTIVVKMPASV